MDWPPQNGTDFLVDKCPIINIVFAKAGRTVAIR